MMTDLRCPPGMSGCMQVGVQQLAVLIAAKSPVAAYGTKRICLHAR